MSGAYFVKIYRIAPEPGLDLDSGEPDFAEKLARWYSPPQQTFVRANLVSSPSGRLVGSSGDSRSLSNPIDRQLVRILRSQADAVIVGGHTVRAEPVPVPPHAPLVILSSRGDLSGHRVSPASLRPGGVLVITGSAPDVSPAEFFPQGTASHHLLGDQPTIDPSLLQDFLRGEGFQHLLLEGGQLTLTKWLEAGLVDELALTLTGPPLFAQQPPLPWWKEKWGEWKALGVATDSGKNLYFRFRAPFLP